MSARIELVLICIAAGVLQAAVLWPVLVAALAPFARVQLANLTIGMGPKLVETRVGSSRLRVNLFPLMSHATAVGGSVYELEELRAARATLQPGRVLWREASRWRRAIVVAVVPRLVAFLIAAAVLGLPNAWGQLARGVVQVATGAVGPFSSARATLDAGLDLWQREGFVVVFAAAIAKALAFSVLTLPGDLAGAIDSSSRVGAVGKARLLLMVLVLLAMASWLLGVIVWVVTHH